MKENIQKYVSIVVVLSLILIVVFFVWNKKVSAPVDNVEVTDPTVVETPDTKTPDNVDTTKPDTSTSTTLTAEQTALLARLQKTVDDKDFNAFADVLLEVYKKDWGNKKEFSAVESKMYVYATNEYWVKGDLENSLRVADIVYTKVVEGWRFRYLRIVTLEKYGRNALNAGDLVKAESYANQILQMMYRPEGANLMADIYIAKIEQNIKDGKLELAKQNLGFIWGFEVSQDRADKFEALKKQLGL